MIFFYPIAELYIDYNGLVIPCCNMISDVEIHKPYILEYIYNNNLFKIFTSEKIINMRKHLYSNTIKDGTCRHCYYKTHSYIKKLVDR
ncbi:SPASM domain-containing protein [Brachyspira pilosicoli]|uniref:SPASM domain-containing protein n=1 Tax=Brachyspira pilosicoli TaxID=52584 RepID=UPI003D6D69B7